MAFFDKAKEIAAKTKETAGKVAEAAKKAVEKKPCAICNTEVGIFSRSHISDGFICTSCKNKLYPFYWFRGTESAEDIRKQIEYRAHATEEAAKINVTHIFGKNMQIKVDEFSGRFVVLRNGQFLTDAMEFSQIKSCELVLDHDHLVDVHEQKTKDESGASVSYNPRRYTFAYKMSVLMEVTHPYFSTMRLHLVPEKIEVETTEYPGFTLKNFNPHIDPKFCEYEKICNEFVTYMNLVKGKSLQMQGATYANPSVGQPVIVIAPNLNQGQDDAKNIGASQVQGITDGVVDAGTVCPNCCEKVSQGKFCPNCGTKL